MPNNIIKGFRCKYLQHWSKVENNFAGSKIISKTITKYGLKKIRSCSQQYL